VVGGRLAVDLLNTRVAPGGRPVDLLREPADVAAWATAYADLAWSAVTMLRDDDPERYRKCANPACLLRFYDDSKPGRRCWYSMELCGGRAKSRAFRRRWDEGVS
jgi:predicted RNA-binding Zn ribbon-like protein